MIELLIVIGLVSLVGGFFKGFVKLLLWMLILGACLYLAVPLFCIGLIVAGVWGLKAWFA